MTPIYGFYHIWLKNHWQEIVKEQLSLVVESGFYEACKEIQIGVLGDDESLKDLELMISCLPKIKIKYHSTNEKEYEFATLKLVKDMADNSHKGFIAYYFHVKGCTWPIGVERKHKDAYVGGNYWRKAMSYYLIKKYEDCYNKISWGSDICGIKYLSDVAGPAYQAHMSGNFWAASSKYLKTLPPVVHSENRYDAEFWIGKGNPKWFSFNQDWMDYHTQKIWRDPEDGGPISVFAGEAFIESDKKHITTEEQLLGEYKFDQIEEPEIKHPELSEKKNRNIVHTLSYNLYTEVEKAVTDLYCQNHSRDFIHVLVDLHFPLEEGDKVPVDIDQAINNNSIKLQKLARRFGSRYVTLPNKGVSQNWEQVAKFMNVGEGDVLIGADPDERPQSEGWVKAMGDVMRADTTYGLLCLLQPDQLELAMRKGIEHGLYEPGKEGIIVLDIQGSMSWAQIGVSGKLISEIGGFPVPTTYNLYGDIEGALNKEMRERGYKWGMMRDHLVVHDPQWDSSLLFRNWKHYIIDNGKGKGQIKFEDWLKLYQEGKIELRLK